MGHVFATLITVVMFVVVVANGSPGTNSTVTDRFKNGDNIDETTTTDPDDDDDDIIAIQPHLYIVENYCQRRVDRLMEFHDAVLVRSQAWSEPMYKAGINCTMKLKGIKEDIGLIVTTRTVETHDRFDNLTLKLAGQPEPITFFGSLFKGNSASRQFYVTGSEGVEVTWITANRTRDLNSTIERGFFIVVTAFKEKCEGNDTFSHGCFKCANGPRFISAVHVCDGQNNCGDLSDEQCDETHWNATKVILIVVVTLILVSAGVIASFWLKERLRPRAFSVLDDSLQLDDIHVPGRRRSDETTPLCQAEGNQPETGEDRDRARLRRPSRTSPTTGSLRTVQRNPQIAETNVDLTREPLRGEPVQGGADGSLSASLSTNAKVTLRCGNESNITASYKKTTTDNAAGVSSLPLGFQETPLND